MKLIFRSKGNQLTFFQLLEIKPAFGPKIEEPTRPTVLLYRPVQQYVAIKQRHYLANSNAYKNYVLYGVGFTTNDLCP